MHYLSQLSNRRFKTLKLILGDQLNAQHSWFQEKDPQTLFLIAELKQETDYAKHHIQKVAAFFASMGNFALALKSVGHQVAYLTLDDTCQFRCLTDLLHDVITRLGITSFHYQQPDEYRLASQLQDFCHDLSINTHSASTEHFFLEHHELTNYFSSGTGSRMEMFYRKMRKRFSILMDNDKPLGDKWNFDKENRNKIKPSELSSIPEPLMFETDVSEIIERLKRHQVLTIGNTEDTLFWPVSRIQAKELLHYFCRYLLPNFGKYQDAMTANSVSKWSLYHSRLSFALNSKMLSPHLVVSTAIEYFQQGKDHISLAQIEGFVRQILGWREFVRGIYWANMPNYSQLNSLNAQQHLPDFFWTGQTKMKCMSECINQSLDYAYAHHIQRLMVTGNFCLLTGINPDEVDDWYLGIYIDAIEWVEMPNTRGMSQFADGGLLASKPYAASGNYINKMSDYCSECHYSVKEKVGERACPFNSLYWLFMVKHREMLAKNPRTSLVFKNWDKQDEEARQAVVKQAEYYLHNIERL